MDCKYRSNHEGKKQFIHEVIKPFVLATGEFTAVQYIDNENGEWIAIYKDGNPYPVKYIDITADSIAAIYVDFCKYFSEIVKEEMY